MAEANGRYRDNGVCTDTYENCYGGFIEKAIYRPCTDGEKRTISLLNVFIKQLISLVLLFIALWYLFIERFQTSPPRFFEDAFSFDFCLAENFTGVYLDGGASFCQIKITMTFLSLVLLIPYWLQTQAQVAVIMVSCISPDVLVPISKGEYVGTDPALDILFSSNLFYRTFIGPFALVQFLVKLITKTLFSENAAPASTAKFIFEAIWKFVVFVLPDTLLTISLFPIAIFLMQNSSSTDELFVNIVAVQVFAEIDDVLVKLLVAPRETVGDTLRVYSRPQKSAIKAKYEPLMEYILALNRHNFGFQDGAQEMKPLYDYTGFRFISEPV